MFLLNNVNDFDNRNNNYPKYLIFLEKSDINKNNNFYYVVSRYINFYFDSDMPEYLSILEIKINLYGDHIKFNLDKLGDDYLFNTICTHFRKECRGSYPDNYVFVNEPLWPNNPNNIINRDSLKNASSKLDIKLLKLSPI